jgi:hypothetical protein
MRLAAGQSWADPGVQSRGSASAKKTLKSSVNDLRSLAIDLVIEYDWGNGCSRKPVTEHSSFDRVFMEWEDCPLESYVRFLLALVFS